MPFSRAFAAVGRARVQILWVAITYGASVTAGVVMAHQGIGVAVRQRDELVAKALQGKTLVALDHGFPVRAAAYDFAGNLLLGAVPSTFMGLAVVTPFPVAAYRGWVGGIVSVDRRHRSRFRTWREGSYYLGVLLLQLIPYTLAGGAGVRLGLAYVFPRSRYGYAGARRLGFPLEAVRDVGWIYTLVAPLFLVASLVEFLAR